MFVFTHALAPVVIANAVSAAQLVRVSRDRLFSRADLIMIAVAGASPDLLSPHWKLSARLQSPTHTLWYLLAIYPVCMLTAVWLAEKTRAGLVAHCMWLAVMLHLLCDALAGGIAWLYPVKPDVIGDSYIPFSLWWVSDVIMVCATVSLHFTVIRLEMNHAGSGFGRDGKRLP